MIGISLTEFVDFVSRAGTPKLTLVRGAKQRHAVGYSVQTDFYKPLRDRILQMHKQNLPRTHLDDLLDVLTDRKKQVAYPPLIQGYKKFLGKKDVKWFAPPRAEWIYGEVSVMVNPELGLEINGQPHVIKLYFKGEKLSRLRMEIVNHLMMTELPQAHPDIQFGILDVRNSKLLPAKETDPSIRALLEGEAESLGRIYESLPPAAIATPTAMFALETV